MTSWQELEWWKSDQMKEEFKTKILEFTEKGNKDFQITNIRKIELMKGMLIELKDLRNRSMQSNLTIKGFQESLNEKWEDTSHIRVLCSQFHTPLFGVRNSILI